ncbi:putative GST N-terminal domain-containing protein [Seiridium unicorne]|uniref:GST N-terminal domain-containing protein n=1 Tax=Seiridium unicorne TaxID=138068 RepID=A0ABR2UVZ3_9PEZI
MDPTSTQFQSPGLLVHGIPASAPPNPNPNPQPDHQNPHLALHHNVSVSAPPTHHFSLPTLPSHGDLSLGVLDTANPSIFHQHPPHTHAVPELQHLSAGSTLPILQAAPHQTPPLSAPPLIAVNAPAPPPPPHSAPPTHGAPGTRAPPFGVVTAAPLTPTTSRLQQEEDFSNVSANGTPVAPESAENRPHGQLVNRIVVDPPNLEAWRNKLFNVDEMILLSNEEFETYFPHIDNVYSHRSTQKYKRKPFVSHYWDCRMKGRPPGTPKSNDPLKKKRKRNARERDLCDVKIKITEYFPGATLQLDDGMGSYPTPQQFFDSNGMPIQPGANGEKFWTIQRVNGNGGNGKADGVAGPHKHSLAKSDEIKKSTVQRYITSQRKESKKTVKPLQRKASGTALATARKHAKEHEMKLYAACFCPFSQRVWIALELKQMQYQYCETDPYKKPTQLLEANPRGTVPAIREGEWACGESSIILEYLEDHDKGVPLFPTDPRLKANCRLWVEHINSKIVPSYFALLRAVNPSQQGEHQTKLHNDILALVQAADERGPYFLGADLCLVDIHFAPFVLRLSRMLTDLRGWREPIANTRWFQWVRAIETNPHIQATTSNKDLYMETADFFLTGQQNGHIL